MKVDRFLCFASAVLLISFSLAKFDASSDHATAYMIPSVPAQILHSTVKVKIDLGQGRTAWGSATAISSTTYLTAAHLVLDEDDDGNLIGGPKFKAYIQLKQAEYKASVWEETKVLGYDSVHDLAILEVETGTQTFATFGEEGDVKVGDPVWIIGAPVASSPQTTTLGWLASEENELPHTDYPYYAQSSNTIYGGNSGGGVYDANRNTLIGVLVAGTRAPNTAFFVPLKFVNVLLLKVASGGAGGKK